MTRPKHLKAQQHLLAAVAALAATCGAQAHVSYSGRDFGAFSGLTPASATIANQAISGNYGWADATDGDWGDSHKARWFTFTLDTAATVTISAAAKANATATSIGGLIPAFSVYGGTAPITFDASTGTTSLSYDTSSASMAWRATLGFPVEGVWNALGSFQIGNDAGVLGPLSYVGHALDGVGFMGDGLADGSVSRSFLLAAGRYSIVVGGGDYLAQLAGNPNLSSSYGVSVGLSVSPVPEPAAAALMAAGLALLLARAAARRA